MTQPRRQFVKNLAASASLLSLQDVLHTEKNPQANKEKIVCVGAHPDDPESGCGGTLAALAANGYDVTIIYLTRGEAGIAGKTHSQAAGIRTKEAEAACTILKAHPVFAGQVDGDSIVNNEWVGIIQSLLEKEKPSIVFTHWPADTHKDHQAASILTMQAYFRMQRNFELYFFEVCIGEQTKIFHPTDYVDITEFQEQKRRAVYCHVSQSPPDIYNCGHAAMEDFRGREMGVKAAEAFVRMAHLQNGNTLGV